MALPKCVTWWRAYNDQPAGRDGPSVRAMLAGARNYLAEMDGIRGGMTPALIAESGWDDLFAAEVAAVRAVAAEMAARVASWEA